MIELKNASKTYPMGGEDVRALRNVSVFIGAGEFVAIMGPSGSGKSTMLHILGFLDRPDEGQYLLGGTDISRFSDDELSVVRNHVAGFVFQQFHLLKRSTALQNVELPLTYAGKKNLKSQALKRIQDVGLGPRAGHHPNRLSGGEQQRVAIARALVNDPPIIFADEPTGNLDTKSEEAIMHILEELNRQGKTIIMVTHEREVAARAKRIITMRDGQIVSDEKRDPPSLRGDSPSFPRKRESGVEESGSNQIPAFAGMTGSFAGMTGKAGRAGVLDHIKEARHAIMGNKLRSALSMLGILIGVASVIAMMALGEGAKASIEQRLASLGSNLLMVRAGSQQSRGVAMEAGTTTRFTPQDADELSQLPEIRRGSASVRGRGQIVYGSKNWNTQIQGVGVGYETMRAAVPVTGRFFTQDEVRSRERVALIGATIVKELFTDQDPVGSTVRINRQNFRVIGILPTKGSSGWSDDDDVVIVPVTTAMYRLLGKQYVDSIDLEVRDPELIADAEASIRKLVIQRHRLTGENKESFQIRNMAEIQETLQSTTKTITMLLGSIAAISLLVGGIGIMNIMLVSVTERTKEIGLRKAIGARKTDIISQFLIESVVMTSLGGVMGILLGAGIAFALAAFAGWATKITLSSVLMATIFSVVVGVLFGMWPARQAANLNPIQALRYE